MYHLAFLQSVVYLQLLLHCEYLLAAQDSLLFYLFEEKADEICESISIRISNLMNKAEDIFSSLSNLKQKSIILEQRRQKVYQARMVLLGLVLLLGGIIATVLVGISDIEQKGHKYGFLAGFALIAIGVISIMTALIKRKKWI